MHMNEKNKEIKNKILEKYGTYENFSKKTGYARMYISNVLNGKNTMTDDFVEVLEVALDIKLKRKSKISSANLFDYLLESSSLRNDLLIQVGSAIKDIMNNIDLTDELCARVKDDTYNFIKSWRNCYE